MEIDRRSSRLHKRFVDHFEAELAEEAFFPL